MYKGYVPPTPVIQPSAAAVDGIAAADKAETTLEVGKPEPGKDVFAGDDVQEKSAAHEPHDPPPSNDIKPTTNEPPVPPPAAEKPAPKPAAKVEAPVVPAVEKEVVPAAAEAGTTAERKPLFPAPINIAVPLPPAGPVGEEEAVRDKVANELFPDQVIV